MDNDLHQKYFNILQKDCKWKTEYETVWFHNKIHMCNASRKKCKKSTCALFDFVVFFNRPEIKNFK